MRTHLAAEAELVEALTLGPAIEPPRPGQRARAAERTAIATPASLTSATTGELLRFHRPGFELLVPGGAALAPAQSQVVDAAARRRELETRALRQVETARRELGPLALLASPSQRDQVVTAALGLARSRDWATLVALTDMLEADRSVRLPPVLGQLRAAALRHEGRLADARALLIRVAGEAVANRRRDPALPLAEARELPPLVHEILVHELAHALLDGATRGRAPSWLHEGLAQHLEPIQDATNLIPDYTKGNRRISVPLIEAVFAGRPRRDLVAVAYDEALWVARYIEHRWGREGFHRLLQSFSRQPNPELALEQALGVDFATLDEQTWKWTLEEVNGGWNPRADRKVRGAPIRQPTKEAAARAMRLESGEGLEREPGAAPTAREAAALRDPAVVPAPARPVPLALYSRTQVGSSKRRCSSRATAFASDCAP